MITILLIIGWILFALASGYSEAGYWYYKYNGDAIKLPKYEHQVWSLMRAVLLLSIFTTFYSIYDWYAVFGILSLACIFPYFHDGMYYYQRDKYDGSYPKGWKDFSKTSTAKFTIDYKARLFMATFLAGLFMLAMLGNTIYKLLVI